MRTTDRALQDLIAFIAVAALAAVALLVPSVAKAAPGDLDPSFGGDGRVLDFYLGGAADMAIDSRGRLVIGRPPPQGANHQRVSALLDNGERDPAFGDGAFGYGALSSITTDVAVDAQGRIYLAGPHNFGGAITRLLSTGALDTSFDEDAIVLTNGGTMGGIAVQPDGKLVTISGVDNQFRFVRYTVDGERDPSFDDDGIAHVAGSVDWDVRATGIAVAPNGDLVALGAARAPRVGEDVAVLGRVASDGDVVSGFTTGQEPGWVVPEGIWGHPGPTDLAVQPDGKVVWTGADQNGQGFVVARVLESGQMDPGFGFDHTPGFTTAQFYPRANWPLEGDTRGTSIAVDPQGRIIAGGVAGHPDVSGDETMALARFTSSGNLDPSFDGDGKELVVFPQPEAQGAVRAAVSLDSQGRIVIAGETPQERLIVARYEGGGPSGGLGDDDGDEGEGGVAGGVAGKLGLKVHRVVVPKSVKGLVRRGVRVLASCDQRCKILVKVDVTDGVASRLGLSRTRIARGSASTGANKRRWVNARLSAAAARAFDDFGGGGRLQIRVRAAGPGAQSATATVVG